MPRFKLAKVDDGTARVVSADGTPLTLETTEGETPEPVTVALDGFQAVEPDPLAGLADNPAIQALQERLAKAEAAAAKAAKAEAEARITADADKLHATLTDAQAPRVAGKVAATAKGLYARLAAHDLDHPPADGAPALAADFKAFLLSLPARSDLTTERTARADADGEQDADATTGEADLAHRQGGSPNGPLTEAQVRDTLTRSPNPAHQAIAADPAKFAAHLARLRATGLAR